MSQNLHVNGKEYLQSAEIAQFFGYTPDYISRLAREGKIVATNVGRKWFIDQESFQAFVQSADIGKQMRSDILKKQRKVELMMHANDAKQGATNQREQSHIALAQSFSVLMCGAFVGLLGWSVSGADMTLAELSAGFEKTYTHIADGVTPDQNPFSSFVAWRSVASVMGTVQQEDAVSGRAPQSSVERKYEVPAVESGAEKQSDARPFSDLIDVRFVTDEAGLVRPVFRNVEDGQEYEVVVAPFAVGE